MKRSAANYNNVPVTNDELNIDPAQSTSVTPSVYTSEIRPNANLLSSVANSFSGFLSNLSWADWLRKQTNINEEEKNFDSSDTFKGTLSSSLKNLERPSKKRNLLSYQLYPEEGTADVNMANENSKSRKMFDSGLTIEKPIPPSGSSSFNKYSFISSTPLSPNGEKKNRNENLDEDSYLAYPSTSGPQKENLQHHRDHPNVQKSPSTTQLEDMQHVLPSRKRFRDSFENDYQESQNTNSDPKKDLDASLFNLHVDLLDEVQQRKRPRFSISTYGSPLTLKDKLEDSSSSIFYPGKVMYGGASNYQKKKNKYAHKKVCHRSQIKASSQNVTNIDGDVGLSSAAKRILNCIDKISTPLSSSKRMCLYANKPQSADSSYVADFYKHRPSLKSSAAATSGIPPNNKLLTPSKVKLHKGFSYHLDNTRNNVGSVYEAVKENFVVSSNSNYLKKNEISPETSSAVQNHGPVVHSSKIGRSPSSNERNGKKTHKTPDFKPKLLEASKTSSIPGCMLAVPAHFHEPKTNKEENSMDVVRKTDLTNNVEIFSFSIPEVLSSASKFQSLSSFDNLIFSFNMPVFENENHLTDPFTPTSGKLTNNNKTDEICYNDLVKEKQSGEVGTRFEYGEKTSNSSKFKCEVCQMQNDSTNLCCVHCQSETQQMYGAEKIVPSVADNETPIKNNWGELFRSPVGWECEVCLVQNEDSILKCVACQSSKPDSLMKTVNSPSSNSLIENGWGNTFKTPSDTWECQTCLIQNSVSLSNCVACQSLKPGNKVDFANNQLHSNKEVESENKLVPSNWGTFFKKPSGTWECQNCLLENNEMASKCVACEAVKTLLKSDVTNNSKETFLKKSETIVDSCNWGDSFKMPEGMWECEVCLLQNKSAASNCIACNSVHPNKNVNDDGQSKIADAIPIVSEHENVEVCSECMSFDKTGKRKCENCRKFKLIPKEFKGSFDSKFFQSDDEWECETCLVRNKVTSSKCVSCETPKVELNKSIILSEVVTGNFKFGTKPVTISSTTTTTTTTTSLFPRLTPKESFPAKNEFIGDFFKHSSDIHLKNFTMPNKTTIDNEKLTASNKLLITKRNETQELTTTLTHGAVHNNLKLHLENTCNKEKTGLKKRGFDEANNFSTSTEMSSPTNSGATKLVSHLTTFPNSLNTLNKTSSQNIPFAFGQANTMSLSSGFSFGGASSLESASKSTVSVEKTVPSLFQFGQANANNLKKDEKTNNIDFGTSPIQAAPSNPFSVTAPEVSSRRVVRKAYRRNK